MSQSKKAPSNVFTIAFVMGLCCTCALILAVLSSSLKELQENGEMLERNKQMLMAAQIYSHNGYFQVKDANGDYIPARFEEGGVLVPGSATDYASADEIFTIFERRIRPYLVNDDGEISTFEDAGLEEGVYIRENSRKGFADLPWKLIYAVFPNEEKQATSAEDAEAYVFPVAGFGLWDAIYGYLAVANDGNRVVGISWYQHKETPGLGANITAPRWLDQFPGKQIFQMDRSGNVDLAKSPIGITVQRGKVRDTLGDSPKANSAVDGMSGATLTGNGVTKAYKETLSPYRPFLIRVNELFNKQNPS